MPFGFLLADPRNKPRWREDFEYKIREIEKKSGIKREQLLKLADVLEEMEIIRL